jgi:hypothetical protein
MMIVISITLPLSRNVTKVAGSSFQKMVSSGGSVTTIICGNKTTF